MNREFVLVEIRKGWYQLIHRNTLQCISAGASIEIILKVLRKYILNYRTTQRMDKRFRQLLKAMPVSPLTGETAKEHIRDSGDKYQHLVDEVVYEALGIIKEETSPKKLMARKKLVPKKKEIVVVDDEPKKAKVIPKVGIKVKRIGM